MAHLQYMPGDPRLVDQLVYELKSKGIFDQFRKECIADVDTRPAYQNLRQRVENSVSTFLSRQSWQPDMNKNQLREKLRKHILDGNYLEQGVERIVDQVVNPKVATVFIPKVEDLVYTVLGITRKKSPPTETTSNEKVEDLLPNDLEAVSPGSVKSNDDKNEEMDVDSTQDNKMEIDEEKSRLDTKDDSIIFEIDKENTGDIQLPSGGENDDIDKSNIPLPSEEIKPENIPSPDTSPPKVELEKIELPKEPIISTDIPLPNDICQDDKDHYFKPVNSEEDDSSSDSSLRRNMSPLTPIRNYNNENSCDAQQAFENDTTDSKNEDKKEPSSFRFKLDAKLSENSSDAVISAKKEGEINLSYQFNAQVNINNFNTPLYEDSSNSNNLQIDYESDANSKAINEIKVPENDQNSEDYKKEKKTEEKKSSHKSSHRSRDSHRHSSSKDKKSDSKHSSSRDSSRHDKTKSSKDHKDDSKSKSSEKDKSKDKNEKKDSSRDSSRHRSSHKSSHRDSKSHRSSSSSGRHSSKHSDDKKLSSSSSNHKDKCKIAEDKDKTIDKNLSDKSKDSKSSSHRSDKDRKSSSSSRSDKTNSKSKDDKDKDKKSKKENDDHYSLSGRGNPNRRSTDRDSNDGSSSSKGSRNPPSSISTSSKKDSKTSSKSESTPTSDSTSPSDKENIVREHSSKTKEAVQHKPIIRIERQLEMSVASPPRLPFVPDVTIRKPKFAANLEEAKRLMKMRRFLDEEQKRMNQEAALLLEFQANVRPNMSQVYSSIPGPELEFACVSNVRQEVIVQSNDSTNLVLSEGQNDAQILDQEGGSTNALNEENDVNNVLAKEYNIDVAHKQENIKKSHYTNNELLIVLDDSNDKKANKDLDFKMMIDNVNETNTETVKDTQNDVEISENYQNENIGAHSVENVSNNTVDELLVDNTAFVPINELNELNKPVEAVENNVVVLENNDILTKDIKNAQKEGNNNKTGSFKVAIITEELSETEEVSNDENLDNNITKTQNPDKINEISKENKNEEDTKINGEDKLLYFGEHEKYSAELERAKFNIFFKEYTSKIGLSKKLYVVNCNSYEENIFRDVSKEFGDFEIVSYHKNGHLKLPSNKNVIKNVNISTEISLPIDADYENENNCDNENMAHNMLSADKSECSFELCSDYDRRLEEMVNKTSRQEIMEIILGNVIDSSPSKMPQIDYLTDSNIDSEYGLKRKISEMNEDATTNVNNNRPVLTPNKIRKLSTDQITSTTQENEVIPNNKTQGIARSKYLGKAKRVGLPRPKRALLPNSPSSDKSVENYEQNAQTTPTLTSTPNGKLRRSKVQRYDTSDLYKPKLHYLSRRNHVT